MKFIELGKEEQRDIIRVLKQRAGMSEQIIALTLFVVNQTSRLGYIGLV